MRIALVSQEYPPETGHGGIATQTRLKAHGLARLGHEVHVICHAGPGSARSYKDGAVHVIRVDGASGSFTPATDVAAWLSHGSAVAAALEALNTRSPLDLVDFPEWAAEGYVHLLNRSDCDRGRGPAVTVHMHGPLVMFAHELGWPDLQSDFYRVGAHMESTSLRLADAVYSSSAYTAGWAERCYGFHAAMIPVLHAGVDTDLFAPSEHRPTGAPVVLFAGRLVANKGAALLVEACCELADEFPDLRLRLVGDGEAPFIEKLKSRARTTGRECMLELPGPVDREALRDEFNRATIFAAPSRVEGGPGFVYLEAMACGLPVIACSGSGVAEVVSDGKHGYLVPPDDVSALTAALRRLLGDPELRATMGAAAHRHVLETAETGVCVAQIADFFATVVANRRVLP